MAAEREETDGSEPSAHPLRAVLSPRSVAVIGASADPTKRGWQAIRALRDAGFAGDILPVNPKRGEILGLAVHESIAALPQAPELALVCTPAASVPQVLESCAARGIRGAIVLALGFGESGEGGAALERSVVEVTRRTGIRVVGPNTSGILNPAAGLNLVGLPGARAGRIAILVQSGNILLGMVNELAARFGEGVSVAVGMGNQVDIRAHEYLDYLDRDPGTRAIAMYIEGVHDGRAFVDVARRIVQRTPVVVLKGGRTDAGRSSARSHTGAIAGAYDVFRAAMRGAGVIDADRTDELAPLAVTLAWQPPVRAGRGIAVLSDGGGHATLAADLLTDRGVPLAQPGDATRRDLRALLGPAAAVGNPIDLAGAADRAPEIFAEALRIVLADENVGGVLVAGLFGGYAIRFAAEIEPAEAHAAEAMAAHAREARKPVIVHSLYASSESRPIRTLMRTAIPAIDSLDIAARCAAALVERGRKLEEAAAAPVTPAPVAQAVTGAADPLERAEAEGRTVLLEPEARVLVERHGVVLAPARFCATPDETGRAAEAFGGPVALKAISPSAPHRTEAGGVALNVAAADATDAHRRLMQNVDAWARARGLPADCRGVLVLPMLAGPAVEVLVGVRRDPVFGPVLTVGVGGTLTELISDVALRLLPVDEATIDAMLDETRLGVLLRGWRGGRPADRRALVRLIRGVADTVQAEPRVAELEANPVFAGPDGAVAVDVRAFLADRKSLP